MAAALAKARPPAGPIANPRPDRPRRSLPRPSSSRPDWLARHDADPAYQWARRAWDIAAAQPGAWFDAAKAQAVVDNWPQWFKLTTDRFAGVPFRLVNWQEIIVRLMVGWKRPSQNIDPRSGAPVIYQVRVFRRLLLWIARKNGKSEFLAALGLLFFIYERLPGCEGYCFASDEEQARVTFSRMKAMLLADAGLTGGATPRVTFNARGIYVAENNAGFHLLAGNAEGKHGKMPQVILGDEMHEWKSREMETTLRQGSTGRLQPVELYASTAGLKSRPVGFGLWEETLAIVDGHSDDTATLACVFAAGPDDDWQDEAVWKRANPNIGLSPVWDAIRAEAAKARNNPRAESEFRRYHLNQWVEQAIRWLPAEKWLACSAAEPSWRGRLATMAGRAALGALDVSSTQDITALVWLFPPERANDPYIVVPRFWIPEATLERRARVDRKTPWLTWAREGMVETTPGDCIDQNFVKRAVLDGLAAYDVQRIGFDPWNATKLVGDLQSEGVDNEVFMQIRQGIASLGEPSKEFERLVFSGRLDHGQHPVLAWMARNVTVRFDENMNFMPARKRSADKIDGIVATVMAVALTMAETDHPSVYAERGALVM